MDWITGILTIISLELIRRKHWQGFALGLFNQVLWVWLAYDRELPGLYLLSIVLACQYGWNMHTWRARSRRPLTAPYATRMISLELDRLDYDAVQTAICLKMVAPGYPPEPRCAFLHGRSNAAGTALAEISRVWIEMRCAPPLPPEPEPYDPRGSE